MKKSTLALLLGLAVAAPTAAFAQSAASGGSSAAAASADSRGGRHGHGHHGHHGHHGRGGPGGRRGHGGPFSAEHIEHTVAMARAVLTLDDHQVSLVREALNNARTEAEQVRASLPARPEREEGQARQRPTEAEMQAHRAAFEQHHAAMEQIENRTADRIRSYLTPEQASRFDAIRAVMQQERAQRRQEMQERRGQRPSA